MTTPARGGVRQGGHKYGAVARNKPRLLKLSEKRFHGQVEQFAALRGWISWHDTDSRRNTAGFPDLLLIRERLVWAELKSEAGKLRPAQESFIERLLAAGQEVHVWRPSQWAEIEQVLK